MEVHATWACNRAGKRGRVCVCFVGGFGAGFGALLADAESRQNTCRWASWLWPAPRDQGTASNLAGQEHAARPSCLLGVCAPLQLQLPLYAVIRFLAVVHGFRVFRHLRWSGAAEFAARFAKQRYTAVERQRRQTLHEHVRDGHERCIIPLGSRLLRCRWLLQTAGTSVCRLCRFLEGCRPGCRCLSSTWAVAA